MINRLHAQFHRPENGWDPVPSAYARNYAGNEWHGVNEALLEELDCWVGGLSGKRVLDLGGGPGQYSIAFALRGADVTWYDVSGNYRAIAEEKAREHAVVVTFVLGYLDEAPAHLFDLFDLVFCRICWNYSFSDRSFADVVFSLVRPGGVGYVDTNHSECNRFELSASARFRAWLNDHFAVKIGHPFPPHGRLARLFMQKDIERFLVDYRSRRNDRLVFVRRSNDS